MSITRTLTRRTSILTEHYALTLTLRASILTEHYALDAYASRFMLREMTLLCGVNRQDGNLDKVPYLTTSRMLYEPAAIWEILNKPS